MCQLPRIKTIACILTLTAAAGFTMRAALAEPPAGDAKKAEPAKSEPAKTQPAKSEPAKVQPGHEGHDHAGHDHAGHSHQPPNGGAPGTAPGKPAVAGATPPRLPDVPAPTVQNKPGEVPKIAFDTPVYDFGRVKSGDEIRKDFWFTNAGNGILEILKVRPACGCTTAGEHDKIVDPGKTGKVPVKLGTTNMSGPITKTVTIETNCEGAEQTITLQIKGEVWQPVQISPPSASFGRITTADAKTGTIERKVTIVNNTEHMASLGKIESSNPAFKGVVTELDPGKKFELTVTAHGALTSGMASATISLDTGLAEMQRLSVPISAYVTADVEVAPAKLSLPMNRTAPLQRHLYISNNSTKPLTISDVVASNEALKPALTEVKPGMNYRITIDIPADYKIADGGDSISFKTDNESVPLVTVPISEISYGQTRDLSRVVGSAGGNVANQPPAAGIMTRGAQPGAAAGPAAGAAGQTKPEEAKGKVDKE